MDKGYSQWHNIIKKENRHRTNSYHQKAIEQGMRLIQRFEAPENTIPVQSVQRFLFEGISSDIKMYC